jgi:L-rhamnose mutarotase
MRSEYYGYVRRLPSRTHCEILYQIFFADINHVNASLEQSMFREQEQRWWSLAHSVLLTQGPEKLSEDLRFFPALLFQALAVALQYVPSRYDVRLDELKFGPAQTFPELSKEYADCGLGVYKSLGKSRPTFVAVQYSFMRDMWLINKGDLTQAWNHSGQSVK